MEFLCEDSKSLLAQVNHQEKELKLKRRWLIGFPMSKKEHLQLKGSMFENDRIIPEYLLREDDVSYETIISFVEKGAGGCNSESQYSMTEDNIGLFDSPNNIKGILSVVENMTNKGLSSFAEILTRRSIKFEKTRKKMKHIIKGRLPEVLEKKNDAHYMNISKNLFSLLKDPHNFRWTSETLGSQSDHAAVLNILDGLEDLPTQTLSAMHRKLRGKEYVPQLQSPKSGWRRDDLIKCLRRSCMGLLSELGEGDELQEPLMKAMEVANLTLKLTQGCHYVSKFKQFSPQQHEIAKSISLLKRMKFPELKKLQFLLDPNAETSKRSLRTAIRTLLTEYLFECSDMDPIPECLQESLAIIKKSSEAPYKHFSEKNIEEEVESILNVSAQVKQVVWDLIPEHSFDLEFADAYIEELEESDDGDACEDIEQQEQYSHSSDSEVESTGEINPPNCDSPSLMPKGGGYSLNSTLLSLPSRDRSLHNLEDMKNVGQTGSSSLVFTDNQNGSFPPARLFSGNCIKSEEPTNDSEKHPDFVSSNFSSAEKNLMCDEQSTSKNRYLAVQAASDETSMVAYCLIGRVLDEFAQIEGRELSSDDTSYLRGYNSICKNCRVGRKRPTTCEEDCCSLIFEAVEELIPSLPQCEKERPKQLMSSK